jgi:hypothetical protein
MLGTVEELNRLEVAEPTGGGTVVNVDVASAASALPARSFTPDEPPLTTIVYVAEFASAVAGVNVTEFVALL